MKLSKRELKLHHEALELLKQPDFKRQHLRCPCAANDNLCPCDRDGMINGDEFVFQYYHPGADHNLAWGGIYFTPLRFAWDLATWCRWQAGPNTVRIVDACAGIGALAWTVIRAHQFEDTKPSLTCIEINPTFVEIGKRLVPEAEWICGDVHDILPQLAPFQGAVSNPPFGNVRANASKNFPNAAQFGVLDLLVQHCESACLILPEQNLDDGHYERFRKVYPDALLTPGSFESKTYEKAWRGAQIRCQIATLEFTDEQPNPYLKTRQAVQTPVAQRSRCLAGSSSIWSAL